MEPQKKPAPAKNRQKAKLDRLQARLDLAKRDDVHQSIVRDPSTWDLLRITGEVDKAKRGARSAVGYSLDHAQHEKAEADWAKIVEIYENGAKAYCAAVNFPYNYVRKGA